MAGKATVFAPTDVASLRLSRKQAARSSSSPAWPLCQTGPTVWMTHVAGRSYPRVIRASPVGQPPICLVASNNRGPAARWIAPSTPPPPRRDMFAALTMASTGRVVISAWMTSMRAVIGDFQAKKRLQPDGSLVDEIAAAHLDLARVETVMCEAAAVRRFGNRRGDPGRDTEIEAVGNQEIG